MKLVILPAVALSLALCGSVVSAHGSEKVYLCHQTDSETHAWVVQSVNANEVQSHEANGDFLFNGPTKSNGHPDNKLGPEWCANHQSGDVCPNIAGLQEVLPENMEFNSDKQCVVKPPTDTPPSDTPPVDTTPPVTTTTNNTVTVQATVPGFQGK